MNFKCHVNKPDYRREWHRHFCLLPKHIKETEECRWLEVVQRKGTLVKYKTGSGLYRRYWRWEYKLL